MTSTNIHPLNITILSKFIKCLINNNPMNYNQLIELGMSFGLKESQLEMLETNVNNFLNSAFEMTVNFPNLNRLCLMDSLGNSVVIIRNEVGKFRLSQSNRLAIYENHIPHIEIDELNNLTLKLN